MNVPCCIVYKEAAATFMHSEASAGNKRTVSPDLELATRVADGVARSAVNRPGYKLFQNLRGPKSPQ